MKNDLSDYREICMLIDEDSNALIFPYCRNPKYISGDGLDAPAQFVPAEPLALKRPYTVEDMAAIIEKSIDAWDTGRPYAEDRVTIEEKAYAIKGFKNAMRGKRLISLGWDHIGGKYVLLGFPVKSGKHYMTIADVRLDDEADWLDFANAVIELINMDLSKTKTFMRFKNRLNLSE